MGKLARMHDLVLPLPQLDRIALCVLIGQSVYKDECMLNSSRVRTPGGDPQATDFDSIGLGALLLPDRQAFYPAGRYYHSLLVFLKLIRPHSPLAKLRLEV